ncbi:MAG: 4Fe-4S binding protein [Deltaproteobacteria bacterium]|nr:4Fe-4S binding protein [Deltaproteobacteria bacterium]
MAEGRTCGAPRSGCEWTATPRVARRLRPVEERIRDFEPAELPAEREAGTAAAARCFGASTCRACEICILICPDLCITRDPVTQRIVIDLDYCKGCGLCAHHCPKGAIGMELDR